MKLDVIQPDSDGGAAPHGAESTPWYAPRGGLKFTCQNCGNCCTGGPGYVWISEVEVERLAEFLKLSVVETIRRYCRRIGARISLKEHRNAQGLYDCVFLKEERSHRKLPDGQTVEHTARICTAYAARPLQCRTWPFWPEVVKSPKSWQAASRKCHGMDTGRSWSLKEIERLKNATDWPDRPPTSDRGAKRGST